MRPESHNIFNFEADSNSRDFAKYNAWNWQVKQELLRTLEIPLSALRRRAAAKLLLKSLALPAAAPEFLNPSSRNSFQIFVDKN